MAASDIGLTAGVNIGNCAPGTTGYRIYELDDAAAIDHRLALEWSTNRGSAVCDAFTVTLAYTGYEKGMPVETGWSDTVAATLAASACNESAVAGGRTWWYVSLNAILATLTGGTWRYETRKYDQIQLRVSITPVYTSEFSTAYPYAAPETSWATLFVGYIPEYTVTGMYYSGEDSVTITYTTTWTRTDDRYSIEADSAWQGNQISRSGKVWGTVMSGGTSGRITFPASKLAYTLIGKTVKLHVRWNAAYRPAGMDFADWTGAVTVDASAANTPTIARAASATWGDTGAPRDLRIVTGDSGDKSAPLSTVTVKLRNSKFDFDQVTVAPGETAVLRFPPYGVDFYVDAWGTYVGGSATYTSAVTSLRVPALDPAGAAYFEDIDTTAAEPAHCSLAARKAGANLGPRVSVEPDVEVVKLAGRRRPSAFYGTGGTASLSFSGVLLNSTFPEWGHVLGLPERGDLMARFPDGDRYAVTASVTETRTGRAHREIAFEGQVVRR